MTKNILDASAVLAVLNSETRGFSAAVTGGIRANYCQSGSPQPRHV